MITYLTISLDDVYAGIGPVYHDYPAETKLKPARPWERVQSYGLLLYWPKKEAWLTVDVVAQASPSSPPVAFAGNRDAAEFVCRTHGVDAGRVVPAGFQAAAEFRVGSLTSTTDVSLRLAIDTSHESFREALRNRDPSRPSELVQMLNVRLFDVKSLNANFEQVGTISLILRPACPVPPYFGVVALDLGNTSSDLATISKRDAVYRTASLALLDAESTRPTLGENATALTSAVRIDRIISTVEPPAGTRRFPDSNIADDDLPTAIDYVAGRLAAANSAGAMPGLILGAKRLVSSRDAEAFRKLVALHRRGKDEADVEEEMEVRNRLPAELLACRLLEKFRTAAKAWPGELAVTYPTTYTPRELARLTQAVERAWLRMQGQYQRLGIGGPPEEPDLARIVGTTQARLESPADGGEAGVIRLLLDEATAAAFFFLYRRVFESPGGLLRFRYLFPEGMNMLLYDCGGGTTDIALVRVVGLSDQHLRIGVLGRTGLRDFGGDDITRALARLLKAKILAEAVRVRGKVPPNPPAKANDANQVHDNLETWLRKVAEFDPNDQLLPTKFSQTLFDTDTRSRRRYSLEFWQLAEKVKAKLSTANGSIKFEGIQKFRDSLAEPLYRGLADAQARTLDAQLKTITLHRWEVDSILDAPRRIDGRTIFGPVSRSIDKCNRLIREVLRDRKAEAGLPEEEVHWVVVSGNAARYPIIRERLLEQLQVADLDERLTLDEANLKHAVAKGAAMFLGTTRTPGLQVVIDTEVDLSACLPFDVGYYDLAKRKHTLLYHEHEHYASLAATRVPIHSDEGRDAETPTFFLERRFPGDDEFSRFLAFEFRDGIRGELEVTYDAITHEFSVTDTSTGLLGEPKDLTDADVYIAPPERGDV